MAAHFQVKLGGKWEDYGAEEDNILKRVFMTGAPRARFSLRGSNYEYRFGREMTQKNLDSGKMRDVRPPHRWTAPSKPLMKEGPTTVVRVPRGSAGETIQVPHPRIPGKFFQVKVPPTAKPGQAMIVPVPDTGVDDATGDLAPAVAAEPKAKGGSKAKTAARVLGKGAVLAGAAVGGAVLVDHLDDHGCLDPALDAIGDFAEDAGEAILEACDDVGEWGSDTADDVGDFIMDLF